MKIIDKDNTLESLLSEVRDKKIYIVSAFASGTEGFVSSLLDNGNEVELIVGTINVFTSPTFIEHCASINNEKFSFQVDFRQHNSIHWKLYLIAPDTIIIGSANLTTLGIKMQRDIGVEFKNKTLFNEYLKKVEELKNESSVLESGLTEFFKELDIYKVLHQRAQARMVGTKHYPSVKDWLGDESNQTIPLFIWQRDHSQEEKMRAREILEEFQDEVTSKKKLREFFTFECKKDTLNYSQGDIVLCAKNTGGYLSFYVFDLILFKDGLYYMYSFRQNTYPAPFRIDEIKHGLKLIIKNLSESTNNAVTQTSLSRSQIEEALELSRQGI